MADVLTNRCSFTLAAAYGFPGTAPVSGMIYNPNGGSYAALTVSLT